MRAQNGVKSDGAKTKETKNDPILSILFHNYGATSWPDTSQKIVFKLVP